MTGEKKIPSDCPRTSSSTLSVCLLTGVVIICSSLLGIFAFIQHRELENLKLRVTELEQKKLVFVEDNTREVKRGVKQASTQQKRQGNPGDLSGLSSSYVNVIEEFAQKQLQVLERYCGNSSKICIKGDAGPKGEPGIIGPKGLDGVPGIKGQKGMYGISGPEGPRGDKGEKGDVGPKGDLGLTGSKGSNGFQGEKGDKGDRGPVGAGVTPNQLNQCCNNLAAPHFLHPQTTLVTAPHGSTVTLPCEAVSSPKPDMTFTPAVDPMQLGRYVHTAQGLEISNLQYSDTGTFLCTAHNVFGTIQKYVKLIVTDKVTANITPQSQQAIGGTTPSVDFVCSFTGTPTPNITWYHTLPGRQQVVVTSGVSTSSTTSTLHINSPGALDTGTYKCQANNGVETVTSSGSLTVNSKPVIVNGPQSQTVTSGKTVILRCDTVSVPPAQISWTFPKTGNIPPKDVRVNPDNSITILNVDSFNDGDYKCTASNSYGSTVDTTHLDIVSPLSVTTSPHTKPVSVGDTYVQIQCTGNGNPAPTVKWSKENSPALSASGGKFIELGNGELIITGFDAAHDTGVYTCTGTNGNESGSDKTIVYRNLGLLNCTATFATCTTDIGQACGGHCPGNCNPSKGQVYGYKTYNMQSSICLAAQHAGSGNDVIWHVINGGSTYESKLSNGIQSQYSGPLTESAQFWEQAAPSTGGQAVPSLVGK